MSTFKIAAPAHSAHAAAAAPFGGFAGLGRRLLGRRTKPGPSAAEEARRVRALAHGYRHTDPGFAADLFAAADRHERLNGR
jgi:hypothetical protein